jgi:hypothetical protein
MPGVAPPGRWRRFVARAARSQSEILLFLLYFLMLVPLGLVRRIFVRNPLAARRPPAWTPSPERSSALEDARRQF